MKNVAGMRLSEFAHAGLQVPVYSTVLEQNVIFASNNARPYKGPCVVYRADELRHLVGLEPAALRLVHAAKAAFKGTVTGSRSTR